MTNSALLIEGNTSLLRQMLSLLDGIDDETYSSSPQGFAPHRVGAHLRHILDFYHCFFAGLPLARIDYDNRTRDELVEHNRQAAAARISDLIRLLESTPTLRCDQAVSVHIESSSDHAYISSSLFRELQALASHTIHHLALIALTLRLHGLQVDPDFGMSPSTLRYQLAKS
jgi:hypothetical protein